MAKIVESSVNNEVLPKKLKKCIDIQYYMMYNIINRQYYTIYNIVRSQSIVCKSRATSDKRLAVKQ